MQKPSLEGRRSTASAIRPSTEAPDIVSVRDDVCVLTPPEGR